MTNPKGWETWVLAGCIHLPLHDRAKWAAFIQLIKDTKPDGVGILGDTTEGAALSRYGNPDIIGLQQEHREEQDAKRQIRDAAPNAKLVETLGNHDFETRLDRASPDLREALMVAYTATVTENEHWVRVPRQNGPESVYWVGQLGMKHGYKLGRTGDMDECINWGFDNCLMVGAHSHRPLFEERCMIRSGVMLDRAYANVGTMTDLSDKTTRYFRDMDTARWACAPLVVRVNARRQRGFATRQWEAEQVTL